MAFSRKVGHKKMEKGSSESRYQSTSCSISRENVASRSVVSPGCGREVRNDALRTAVSHLKRSSTGSCAIGPPLRQPDATRLKDASCATIADVSTEPAIALRRASLTAISTLSHRERLHIMAKPTLTNSPRSTDGRMRIRAYSYNSFSGIYCGFGKQG